MKWFNYSEEHPKEKDTIIVKLKDSNSDFTHAYVYVRDTEVLGNWFDDWRYASDEEKYEFGKTDCAYLKENKIKPADVIIDADIAQLAEHPTCNRKVESSTLSISKKHKGDSNGSERH